MGARDSDLPLDTGETGKIDETYIVGNGVFLGGALVHVSRGA
jgi:hypothetical protein